MKKIIIAFTCCAMLILAGCGSLISDLVNELEAREAANNPSTSTPSTSTPSISEPASTPPASTQPTSSPTDNTPDNNSPTETGDPSDPSTSIPTFPFAFTAVDIYGETVTEATLGNKEIFFVHFWATWCPPCIAEMPELGEIVQMYSDRVGFIGLLEDYDTSSDRAIAIKETSNAVFLNIDANHRDFQGLLRLVQSGYVPTTILIDTNGNVIGDQIIGAYGRGYADFIEDALNR